MTRLVQDGLIRLPAAVIREIETGDDRARSWVRRHEELLVIVEAQGIVDRQRGVTDDHGQYFTTARGAADPMVICTALELLAAGEEWTVVTADHGLQVVCHRVGVPLLPDKPFRTLYL